MAVILLLSVSVAVLQIASSQTECPDPVECAVNPCDIVSCPNYVDAVCSPSYCFGECRAQFLLGRQQRDVTDKCEIPSCETRNCPARRPVCIEERVSCPNNRTTCIPSKQVKVSCEALEVVLPSDCNMVVCASDQSCSVEQRPDGPVASCTQKIPERCDEIECKPGEICREIVKDGVMIARCAPERLDAEDCSSAVCPPSTICQLTSLGRPRCVALPPPSSCEELVCDEGYVCRERSERRVVCVQINRPEPTTNVIQELVSDNILGTSCSDLDCPPGHHCVMFGDKKLFRNVFIPRCVPNTCPRSHPPLSCRELECGREEYCAVVLNENGLPRPYCFPYGMLLCVTLYFCSIFHQSASRMIMRMRIWNALMKIQNVQMVRLYCSYNLPQ